MLPGISRNLAGNPVPSATRIVLLCLTGSGSTARKSVIYTDSG